MNKISILLTIFISVHSFAQKQKRAIPQNTDIWNGYKKIVLTKDYFADCDTSGSFAILDNQKKNGMFLIQQM